MRQPLKTGFEEMLNVREGVLSIMLNEKMRSPTSCMQNEPHYVPVSMHVGGNRWKKRYLNSNCKWRNAWFNLTRMAPAKGWLVFAGSPASSLVSPRDSGRNNSESFPPRTWLFVIRVSRKMTQVLVWFFFFFFGGDGCYLFIYLLLVCF